MMWRRRQDLQRRERTLRGDQAVRTAEEIVSVAWINRLRFSAEEDPVAIRLLKRERVVHLHAASRRSRAAAAGNRAWAAMGNSPQPSPSEQTQL